MSIKKRLEELHEAVRNDDIDNLSRLAKDYSDILNKQHNGLTALALCQSEDAIKTLISNGAKLDIVSKDGEGVLYYPCFNRRLDLVKVLLELGAEIDFNGQGDTLLLLSISGRDEEMVSFWLENEIWSDLALIECASAGNPETMKLLLAHPKADIYKTDERGKTPLDIVMHYSSKRHKQIAELLLNKQEEIEVEKSVHKGVINDKPSNPNLLDKLKAIFKLSDNTVKAKVSNCFSFWDLIALLDVSKNNGEINALPLEKALSRLPVEEILRFEEKLTEVLHSLDGPSWMKMSGESSDSGDAFLYVRCFVIARGKAFYEAVLHNPRKMPKTIDSWFEPLLYVAPNAWSKVTGEDVDSFVSISSLSYETGTNIQNWA